MTDEELIARLLARLRKDDTDFWPCEAAGRIEALTAKLATCEKYRDAYDEMGRIGTQAVRDLEAKLEHAKKGLRKIIRTSDMHSAWDIAIATVEKLE
jgi:hypothetical protein